jgi:hypothetical protein
VTGRPRYVGPTLRTAPSAAAAVLLSALFASGPAMSSEPDFTPDQRSTLSHAVDLSQYIVTGIPISRRSYYAVPDSAIYTHYVLHVTRVLKGHISKDSTIACEDYGGTIGQRSISSPDQFLPGVGGEYLLFVYLWPNGVPWLNLDCWSLGTSIHGDRAVSRAGTFRTEALLDTVRQRVDRQGPASLASRSDLVVAGDVSRATGFDPRWPSRSRSGACVLTVRRVLVSRVNEPPRFGDDLSLVVPPPGIINNQLPSRGSTPLLADSTKAVLFLREGTAGSWEPLETAYACWLVEGDSARVRTIGEWFGTTAPVSLAAVDTMSFFSALSEVQR